MPGVTESRFDEATRRGADCLRGDADTAAAPVLKQRSRPDGTGIRCSDRGSSRELAANHRDAKLVVHDDIDDEQFDFDVE